MSKDETLNVSGVTLADLQERLRRMLADNLRMRGQLQRQDAMLDSAEGWMLAELRKDDAEMAAVWQRRIVAVRECRMVTANGATNGANGTGVHS